MNASISASQAGLDPEHVAIIEPVKGSDIPVRLMYVETIDGLYAPIGLRTPHLDGPYPLILFAAGNGGGGMAVVRDFTQNRSWTQEQFLAAGYAVAWMRYRAEVDYAYDKNWQVDRGSAPAATTSQSRPAGIRGRHLHRRLCQDAALHRSGPDRIHGHESRRRNGVQDCVGVRWPSGHGGERTGVARVPQAEARRHRKDRSP